MSSKKPNERIGEFLVRIDAITEEQKEKIIKKQQEKPASLFGQIAIELGYINEDIIEKFFNS